MFTRIFAVLAVLFLVANCGGKEVMRGHPSHKVADGSQEDLVLNVGDRVYFAYNSDELNEVGMATLDRQASWLLEHPENDVMIAGHTDERGTKAYNFALGERRAMAVKKYLMAKGVPSSRMKVISFGKEKSEVYGSNEEAWAKNRRAVTELVN